MAKRIVLTGGGSGGHLYPLVAVVDYLREHPQSGESYEFLYLGPNGILEQQVMTERGIPMKKVASGKYRRYFSWLNILDIFKVPVGIIQAAWHLFRFMPDAVFSKGGYASVPVAMVAWLYRIPLLVHESDALPGMANKFIGSLANRVAVNFKKAHMYFPPSRTVVVGLPIKQEALGGDPEKARQWLKMSYQAKPVVFFLGGSQGAAAINQEIINILPELVKSYQVVHQTGQNHFERVCELARKKNVDPESVDYRPLAYIGAELKDVLALADVVVSRAGATAIAEIAANKKPSILIPIAESANGHQRVNAFEVAKYGGTIVLEEDNFKKGLLLHNLSQIVANDELRQRLITNIVPFYFPDATKQLAEELAALAA